MDRTPESHGIVNKEYLLRLLFDKGDGIISHTCGNGALCKILFGHMEKRLSYWLSIN